MRPKKKTTSAQRVREFRQRERENVGLYTIKIDRFLVADALYADGRIREAANDDEIKTALNSLVVDELRRRRKRL